MTATPNKFANLNTDELVAFLRSLAEGCGPSGQSRRDTLEVAADRLHALYHDLGAASPAPGTRALGSEKAGWKCEQCGNCGTIRFPAGTSVYDILAILEAEHTNEARDSCSYDLARMRAWQIEPVAAPPAGQGSRSV